MYRVAPVTYIFLVLLIASIVSGIFGVGLVPTALSSAMAAAGSIMFYRMVKVGAFWERCDRKWLELMDHAQICKIRGDYRAADECFRRAERIVNLRRESTYGDYVPTEPSLDDL
jgi:hypothetical protein